MKQKNALLGEGATDQWDTKSKRREKRERHSCHSSQLLHSAQLLPSSANLLTPPVTTWFSFTGDSFSLGKLWKAIKKINCFWVSTSSSPRRFFKQ